jgi:hypothetical protein
MRHLHLTHPHLDVWVTVEIYERDGRYMTTSDLGEDSRDVGVGDTPQEAVRAALRSLGEPSATEMAEGVDLDEDEPRQSATAWQRHAAEVARDGTTRRPRRPPG